MKHATPPPRRFRFWAQLGAQLADALPFAAVLLACVPPLLALLRMIAPSPF